MGGEVVCIGQVSSARGCIMEVLWDGLIDDSQDRVMQVAVLGSCV